MSHEAFNFSKTGRGFTIGYFEDLYNDRCSIQESSLADQPAIWLGIVDANPQVMAKDAHRLGVPTTEVNGWIPYPIPEEVLLTTRMHLSREQAKDLAYLLLYFHANGELPEPKDEPST